MIIFYTDMPTGRLYPANFYPVIKLLGYEFQRPANNNRGFRGMKK